MPHVPPLLLPLVSALGYAFAALVRTVGHWFGNIERAQGRAVMFRRLAASALLLAAIALIAQQHPA